MLADNAREDYFDEVDGKSGQVTAEDYDALAKGTAWRSYSNIWKIRLSCLFELGISMSQK